MHIEPARSPEPVESSLAHLPPRRAIVPPQIIRLGSFREVTTQLVGTFTP
jgi:hypothetical protein